MMNLNNYKGINPHWNNSINTTLNFKSGHFYRSFTGNTSLKEHSNKEQSVHVRRALSLYRL